MTTLKPVASADDASDLVSSLMSILPSKHRSYPESRHHVPPKTARSRHIGSISSFASETSLGSSNSSAIRTSPLSSAQTERFQQCVEREYDSLLKSEAGHCCYINDSSRKARANEELLHSANGKSHRLSQSEESRMCRLLSQVHISFDPHATRITRKMWSIAFILFVTKKSWNCQSAATKNIENFGFSPVSICVALPYQRSVSFVDT